MPVSDQCLLSLLTDLQVSHLNLTAIIWKIISESEKLVLDLISKVTNEDIPEVVVECLYHWILTLVREGWEARPWEDLQLYFFNIFFFFFSQFFSE